MSDKVRTARLKRAQKVCEKVLEWQRLAALGEYPRSLNDIIYEALEHEDRNATRRLRGSR